MTLSELLNQQCQQFADKNFIRFERQPAKGSAESYCESLSYLEFNARVNQAVHFMQQAGIKPGQVVNIHLPNCVSFLVLWFACARLGAIMMPTNTLSSENELAYLLAHSESVVSFTTESLLPLVQAAAEDNSSFQRVIMCDPYTDTPDLQSFEYSLSELSDQYNGHTASETDLVSIMYTSGTTSRPKGVMVSHANYIKAGSTVANAIDLSETDINFVALPLFHGNAQYYSTMSALLSGASIVLMDRFSASQFFAKCRQYQATMASLFAAPMRMLLAQPENKQDIENSLRVVLFAQSITENQLLDWDRRFGAPLCQLWGMTETMGPPLMNPLNGERRNHSIGKPIGGYQVKLLDGHGHEVAQGEQGEIVVQGVPGQTIMQGYFKNPEATESTIKKNWLFTGDNAILDEDGYFHFVDRLKDMIKRSGENVSAGEVESVLLSHEDVFECAVFGVPDEIKDEKIIAAVVANSGGFADVDKLMAHCKSNLASFRVPEHIYILTELPKTSVGKIQKHLIKKSYLESLN